MQKQYSLAPVGPIWAIYGPYRPKWATRRTIYHQEAHIPCFMMYYHHKTWDVSHFLMIYVDFPRIPVTSKPFMRPLGLWDPFIRPQRGLIRLPVRRFFIKNDSVSMVYDAISSYTMKSKPFLHEI